MEKALAFDITARDRGFLMSVPHYWTGQNNKRRYILKNNHEALKLPEKPDHEKAFFPRDGVFDVKRKSSIQQQRKNTASPKAVFACGFVRGNTSFPSPVRKKAHSQTHTCSWTGEHKENTDGNIRKVQKKGGSEVRR